ncbi:hypothetical protein GW17_00048256 [Ensete ventricosum]|nr:hypothetical protein GW17_00048256 [Ensete ventricosum]
MSSYDLVLLACARPSASVGRRESARLSQVTSRMGALGQALLEVAGGSYKKVSVWSRIRRCQHWFPEPRSVGSASNSLTRSTSTVPGQRHRARC